MQRIIITIFSKKKKMGQDLVQGQMFYLITLLSQVVQITGQTLEYQLGSLICKQIRYIII